MPHFRLETNLRRDQIPSNFPRELNQTISKALGEGKPEELCAVTIVPDQLMVHGTKEGPCGQGSLLCFGKFGVNENIQISKAIFEKIGELGIPTERLYIHFIDVEAHNVGFMGTTAREVLGTTD